MNSFSGYIGGKKSLREEIVKRFPKKLKRYIELFGGAAWVMFYKDKHAAMEVYNDKNSELVNFIRSVKYHRPEVQRELSFMLNSRKLFEDFKAQYNVRGMTEIQKAARFFMLLKTSYGSNGRSYGCIKKDISAAVEYLNDIEKRLSCVVIEEKDFEDLLKIYDKPDALIYCDPPYFKTERYYQAEFTTEDHARLHQVLKNVKGKFLLSYNDCDYVRGLYKDFTIEEIVRTHNLVGRYAAQDHTYKELIIKNY